MAKKKIKNILWTIKLPMSFPDDWTDGDIEFYLNESSWCCSNLIEELQNYDKDNGCICSICEAKIDKI